ncbi:efflux RND transporter periplasmic adaptor subunit [Dysosmobacter sp. HCP28S3_G4]|uniref:efflux RND transporter periplasmic adaptor subunit n=1 Tax=Dysosmobacter sp. HCP28S3_G4 TaxID=3438938 RepID=UPI003F89D976
MAEVQELVQEQTTPEKVTYGGGGAEQAKKPKNSKKRRRLVRRIIALAAVIAVGAGLVKFLGRGGETESTVVTNEVQWGGITSTVEGSGLTRARNSQTITVATAGTVSEVFVTEGQQVSAGDPLYVIDSQAASDAVTKAKSNVEGYEKQLRALEKDIAGLNLAPSYAGKLTDVVKLNPGDEISKGEKVATLSDDTRMRLQQYYSYAYAGKIHAGQKVEVSIPALMSVLTGTVEKVNMVNRITPEGSQLFEADILVDNGGTLTKDMAASASVTVDGETIYPYEAGVLDYYRTGDLKSTVSGTVISSDLVDYLQVRAGQVVLRIDGEDSENEIFDLQQSLEEAQQSLEEAQKNLDNCSALAPIDGTVMGLAIQTGDEVQANTAVITIADTSTIMIDADVDERHISYVKAGMMVDIDQWGSMFQGVVESVSLNSKAENGVASYPMTISVDNYDGTLMTGSYINYSLVASQNDNCLVLPIQCVKSVQLDDGSSADVVFVQSDDRPENAIDLSMTVDGVPESGYWPVPVEIGIADDFNVEIRSGVQEGDVVFTAVQTQSSYM